MSRRVEHPPAYLYRLHTHGGQLAYVGTTTRLISDRFRDHRHHSRWWSDIDLTQNIITAYTSIEEADQDRRHMIVAESPLYNVHRPPTATYATGRPAGTIGGSGLDTAPPRSRTATTRTVNALSTPQARQANIIDQRQRAAASQRPFLPPRKPGEFRHGDIVKHVGQYETLTGELVVADHPAYMIELDSGTQADLYGEYDNLTLITAYEDRTS